VNGDARAQARRGLAVYFAGVVVASAAIEVAIYATHDPIEKHTGLVLALMWTPALASLVARLVLREGPRDVSFRLGGKRGLRELAIAWLYPLAVGFVAYGIAWKTGLEHYAVPKPGASFARSIGMNLVLGAIFGSLFAGGEEIGWRGYMLTRLIDAGIKRPVLVSGVVWAAWHMPLIVTGQYAAGRYPWLSAVLFVPSVVAAGYVAARVRLASGSLWPAIVFHASWNALIQGSFDRFTLGGNASKGTTLWTGEAGILVVAVTCLFAAALVWRPFEVRRSPRDEPTGTLDRRSA
jgi:membrane protease YdiL (CAAX protease family)